MNEWSQDFELLQRFAHGEQVAFNSLVRRHLDLVFATALRKVEDAGAAQEVAQNVFTDLARKAWRFAPDDSLPAWLHKAVLLESQSWLRGELRRRRREETAVELGTIMKSSDDQTAFRALVPLLDEALLSLREKDRTALLLRFYESQSLRDVGAAFGVSEDTAQKRVQSALEKLTEFFKRRGYKTASVAAAIAALKHTAATASASLVGTIAGGALQGGPVALTGLAALLARLASLTRVQTAAVCVALAAAPVAWQLNEGRVASRELKRIETQLIAGQSAAASLQSELERLRATSVSLEQSVAQANAAAARAVAEAQAFADWKQSTRARLLAADYRWDDNSAFVRIPKAVLPELIRDSTAQPYAAPGVVKPFARELMGMSAEEQRAVEAALQRRYAEVDGELAAGMVETNLPVANGVLARLSFGLPGLSESGFKSFGEQVIADMGAAVGEERQRLIKAKPPEPVRVSEATLDVLVQTNNTGRFGVAVIMNVGFIDKQTYKPPKQTPKAPSFVIGAGGSFYSLLPTAFVGDDLSIFLPDGDPNRKPGIERFMEKLDYLPNAAVQRVVAWLQAQAPVFFNRKENP